MDTKTTKKTKTAKRDVRSAIESGMANGDGHGLFVVFVSFAVFVFQ